MGIRKYLIKRLCKTRDKEIESLRAAWKEFTDAREKRAFYQMKAEDRKARFWKMINESTHPEISPRVAIRNASDRTQADRINQDILKFLGVEE